jgi:hypothetical protein
MFFTIPFQIAANEQIIKIRLKDKKIHKKPKKKNFRYSFFKMLFYICSTSRQI